jgi:protein SCO1/2
MEAEWMNPGSPGYASIHRIDTFSLTSQTGSTITRDSLAGHVFLANFFFTHCTSICPKMTHNIKLLQDSLLRNSPVKFVSFSVMPWADSVARLREYGEGMGIDPNRWYLLTGPATRIYHLARQSFFAEKGLGLQKTDDDFLHTESMLLIDRQGRIRGIYNATQRTDMDRVSEDLTDLLREDAHPG